MKKFTERFFSAPADSFFIFGPRGTGKSTWLKKTFPDAYLVDLLDDRTFRNHIAHPERIKQIVKANPQTRRYIIDEVQKAPALLDSIHSVIEEYKTHQFILTGSSARKLRRGGVNRLAGRALLTHFHPFMAAELGNDFSLDAALRNGLIPLIVSANAPGKTLKTYITLYLKEEGMVRDIGAFARFLETISFSHGSYEETIGYTSIANVADWFLLAYPDEEYRKWVLEKWNADVEKALREGKEIKLSEYNVTCKDGKVRIMEISGTFVAEKMNIERPTSNVEWKKMKKQK